MRGVGARVVKGLLCFRLAFSIARGTFVGFVPIFAGLLLGLTATQLGILIATNILAMSLLQLLGGALADRLDRRLLVFAGGMFNTVFLSLIPLGRGFLDLLWICLLGSLGGGISMPAASAVMVEEGRKFGMGAIMGLFGMAFSMGMGIGPLLGGLIMDALNVRAVFYFGSLVNMLGTAIFFFHSRRTPTV